MNDASNSQGSTGGSTVTGNPQNIGSQTIFSQNQSLQNSTSDLLNTSSSTISLTDPNSQPASIPAPARASVTVPAKPKSNHHAPVIIGLAAVIIVSLVCLTWLMGKSSKSYS